MRSPSLFFPVCSRVVGEPAAAESDSFQNGFGVNVENLNRTTAVKDGRGRFAAFNREEIPPELRDCDA